MPLVGLAISRCPPVVVGGLVVLTMLWSLPALVASREHSLIGDRSIFLLKGNEQMFVNSVALGRDYRSAAQLAARLGCSEIGMHLGLDDLEYPWWRMIEPINGVRRIEHVGVDNLSAGLDRPGGPFQPCVVFSRRPISGGVISLDGRDFSLDRRFGSVAVLRPR
jgi:hypothetical protein